MRQASDPKIKEKLQVLYWLKQPIAPSINAIAQVIGQDSGTAQTWLSKKQKAKPVTDRKIKKTCRRDQT